MPSVQDWKSQIAEEEGGSPLARRPVDDSAEMDITPMIDITFLLLIFFLVASIPDPNTATDLAPARNGKGVSPQTATIITVGERGGPGPPLVYLGDGKSGTPLPDDPDLQEQQIRDAVEQGFYRKAKTTVIVKAERNLPYKEVYRIEAAANSVEGIKMYQAVLESD